ncbi:acyl-CoA dehydrogenase [Rhodococcus sp. MS16]|uniref:acyl-CoA dehydrogenase family protein n=1 Tax=Rhodococcus sp. MS16 TaxID=2579941 RepID=UPI0015625724|nr:acyl-CoA dehydrogenase [Rhodococcus sp. MS16]
MEIELSRERLIRVEEARTWLRAEVPTEPLGSIDTPDGKQRHQEWERKLSDARWSVVHWPERYGGRDYDLLDWLLFEEEYFAASAPVRINQNGITLLGGTLLRHGSTDQQDRILPTISTAEQIWAQAWSEPEAGSDLASVRSTAAPVEGGFVLNGQKTWSSRAAIADRGFGLFRSGEQNQGHRGLTYVMFDLRAPGVTVRPIRRIDGDPVFAEVFFDDVFVPDADVIGVVNEGWRIAMATAGAERGVALRSPGRFLAATRDLIALWRCLPLRQAARHQESVVECWSRSQQYRLHGFASAAGSETAAASLGKTFWSELDLSIHLTALAVLNDLSLVEPMHDLPEPYERLHARWTDGYLFALAGPIYAGTNQIQRNVVAERLLGLPRG